MKQKKWGSITRFERTNRHSRGDLERGPWITVKGLVATVTTNQSQFHNGKLELNKTRVSKAAATEFILKRGVLGLGVTRWGRPQLGLKARHDTKANGPKDGDAAPWQILDVHLF